MDESDKQVKKMYRILIFPAKGIDDYSVFNHTLQGISYSQGS